MTPISSNRPVYRHPREPLSLHRERQPSSIVSANLNRVIAIIIAAAATVLPIAGCTAADEPETEKAPFAVAAAQQEQTVRDQAGGDGGDGDNQSALSVQLRTFDELVDALREHYVFSDHHAVPWDDLESRYRTRVLGLLRSSEFPDVVRDMMDELPRDAAVWQSRDERIDRQSTDGRNYEGIGAYVAFRAEPQPRVILLSVMPGSPAERAGLRDHDALLAVDGIPVSVDEGEEVVNRIRGPAGSVVNLTVRTPNAEPRNVAVTRGSVQLTEGANRVRYALLPETNVAYILLPRQSTSTLGAEVAQALTVMGGEVALRGVILDLRIAALGNNWPLDEMLGMFGNGTLGEMYSVAETIPLVIAGQDVAGSQTLPLALLVGRDTEGLPEIFAGALQSVGRAVLFGARTGGYIEASQLVPLPDGSRVMISSTSYRTATGLDVGLAGLEPNLSVSFDWDAVTEQVDPVRSASQAALVGAGG